MLLIPDWWYKARDITFSHLSAVRFKPSDNSEKFLVYNKQN